MTRRGRNQQGRDGEREENDIEVGLDGNTQDMQRFLVSVSGHI